uniref:ubiquitinyl hydrolase 1 n=1 Tax=Clastoptera arizonana TaxID=38151 RepID=A0A1B6CHY2_9HEMI
MGAKDSKQCCITYEEAVKRVTEPEVRRIREAFKRLSNQIGYIDKQSFLKDVLGEGVPLQISEYIYAACGGTPKGIAFRELLCGLVLLTRGVEEEKIKFLFSLYANENSAYIFIDEFLHMLQLCENVCDNSIGNLFNEKDRVTYEEFKDWLQKYPDVTSLSRWLLSEPCTVTLNNELETPSFYQTLAGVTHLEETDIMELEKRYWNLKGQSLTGKLDEETLRPLISPPIPLSVCTGIFNAFDENRDNHIDFKEMACGISAATRGPLTERQKFCFKVFDLDRDGLLSFEEMKEMVAVLLFVHEENNISTNFSSSDPVKNYNLDEELIMRELTSRASPSGLTIEEYLIWTVENPLSLNFLSLLFQVCHVVLGLRPASEIEEGEIVQSWLRREKKRASSVGQFWCLISYDWWRSWEDFIKGPIISSTGSNSTSDSLGRQIQGSPINVNCNIPENSQSNGHQICLDPYTSLKRNALQPGPIDNSGLIIPYTHKVASLTGEGGILKKNLKIDGCDNDEPNVKLVPDSLFRALFLWYGASPTLRRQMILPKNSDSVELELYPLTLTLLRHQVQPPKVAQPQANTWTGIVAGYGAASFVNSSDYSYVSHLLVPPKRYLAYSATFSRMATIRQVYDFLSNRLHIRLENMRLWHYFNENNMKLIEEEETTLEDLEINEDDQFLIEVRNKDLTWPEEIGSLALNKQAKQNISSPPEKGATGLNNLGNTCFMNASLQCVSNTQVLTKYFLNNYHLYELNRFNPLGMKGHIAKRYGDLIQDMWSGSWRTLPPLKLRWTIGKYAPRFNGSQQHDSQEFLAFLLDGLHEDLNRVQEKPYVELKDSDGRPDTEVAHEAWENHLLRNKSIIVDLYHGQLKSEVKCKECKHESVRFDPFNYLSLPLPMESYLYIQALVICLNGSVPVKYGLRLNTDDTYGILKIQLSSLCGIQPVHIKLTELVGAQIKNMPGDKQKIKVTQGLLLYAYELPPSCPGEYLSINSSKVQRESQTFQAIQRSIHPGHLRESGTVGQDSSVLPNCKISLEYNNSDETSIPTLSDSSTCSPLESLNASFSSQHSYIVAFHRKMLRQDIYFLSSQRSKPSLFGVPVIVSCCSTTTHQDLYQSIWLQVARLVSPLPPPSEVASSNHATDCDDSLGYEFPFVLKAVNSEGKSCAWCPWYRFCKGCRIQCSDQEFSFSSRYLAIDWDPTALHLRYQTLQEQLFIEHESVNLSRAQEQEPIYLDHCLENFTKEEHLGEDEKYYCSKCAKHQIASKKLQIWKLPPILIIHLKRFQYLNEKWIKSQKVVNFPYDDFDPTPYLASIPRDMIQKYNEIKNDREYDENEKIGDICSSFTDLNPTHPSNISNHTKSTDKEINGDEKHSVIMNNNLNNSHNPRDENSLYDFHQHKLQVTSNPYDLRYRLYAIVCHSGSLSGGHYVSYACSPSGKWYCFNDSSCREVTDMDTSSAYMLFYERKSVCDLDYMPDVTGLKIPDLKDLDEEFELDFKKLCRVA